MRLKQIQIQGFKSFVDRAVFDFNDSITCIVGPNGCGKSNLVDAVRWSMGEQSSKKLRGGHMEDVIFHGSDDVAAVGMAESTLIFDNSDGTAPVAYSGFSEIQITRRLFRSGESEYYINRTPCRLKDITDLFLGSGAGPRAYSIIEQGRVEEVITMKPEQRRTLIEEAAGVSKYRIRKQEAERKMEATRNNLVRIRDITLELKKQMNSLNRQAKKAERYKKYRTELKQIELELAALKASGILREQEAAKAKLSAWQEKEQEITTALEVTEADLESAKTCLLELETEFASAQALMAEASRKVEKQEQQLLTARHQRQTLESDRTRLTGEQEELGARHSSLAAEIENVLAEEEGLEKANNEASRALENSRESCAAKEGEFSELLEAASVLEKHVQSIKAGVEKLSERIEWANKRRDELDQRKAGTRERGQQLEASLEVQARTNLAYNEKLYLLKKDLAVLKEEISGSEQKLEQAGNERAVAAEKLQSRQTQHAGARSRLESLREMERNFEGYKNGVKAIMARKEELEAQGKNGTHGLIAEVISSEPEYEVALEAVLGERIQTILVQTRDNGLENIQYLTDNEQGRGGFLPVEGAYAAVASVPGPLMEMGAVLLADKVVVKETFAPAVKALLGDTLVVEDIKVAARAREEARANNVLVTRQGELIDKIGFLAGGSPDSGTGHLTKKRQMEELESLVSALAREKERREDELSNVEGRIKETTLALEQLKDRHYRIEIEKNNLEKDLVQGTQAYNSVREEAANIKSELAGIEKTIEELGREVEEARQTITRDRQAGEKIEQELLQRKAQTEKLRAQAEEQNRLCTEARVELAALREKLEARKIHKQRLEREKGEVSAGIERRGHELQTIKERHQALAEQTRIDEKDCERAVLARKDLEDKALAERARYEKHSQDIRDREAGVKGLFRDREEVKSERMETELTLSRLTLQWDGLGDNTREKFGKDPQDVLAEFSHVNEGEYPREEKVQCRDELRQKLNRMGDINPSAIEEYEEVSERYSFLSNQEADLIQALENLEATIAKINTTYRRAFKKTYDEVNAKFQEVFPRLFSGGVANLQLTDPEDLLDSGVEIMVQLPGKKMSAIALLSGGEKSLTACALIISLFLVNPSPFCLFDEVDAALDDVNIVRFSEIIKELAKNSQLVVITHNKRTMELAETLYGVTMEKKGVSKVVSVRLHKSEQSNAA